MVAFGALGLLSIYILLVGTRNYEKCVRAMLILLLTVPLTSAEPINTIQLLRIGSVNVLELGILELFIMGIFTGKLRWVKKDFISFSVLILLGIYIVDLILHLDNSRSVADAKDYIIPAVFFFCIWSTIGKSVNAWEEFIQISLKALRMNAYMILVLYFALWIPLGYSGRYGFPCETLYVYSIPVQLLSVHNKTVDKQDERKCIFGSLIQLWLLFLSQGRSLLICTIVAVAICALMELCKKNTVKQVVKNVGVIVFMLVALGFMYSYLMNNLNSNVGWVHRMAEVVNGGVNTSSNIIRNALYIRYMSLIKEYPFGVGFGASMPAYGYLNDGMLTLLGEETLAIDSVLLTFSYKLGIIPFILYALCYLVVCYRLVRYKKNGNITNSIFLILILLIVPAAFLSCQALKNLNVAIFVSTLWGASGKYGSIKVKQEDALKKNAEEIC